MHYSQIETDPYKSLLEESISENDWTDLEGGKVTTVHRDGYLVRATDGEYKSQLLGHLLYEASSGEGNLPVVGDWVVFQAFDDQGIIHGVLPRKTTLARETGRKGSDTQVIVANADGGLIVMGADRDFNLNRVERYLALCYSGELQPLIVVTKVETLEEDRYTELSTAMSERFDSVPFFLLDSISGKGLSALQEALLPRHTYAMMGSSGAGKSTLLNALAEEIKMKTGEISEHVNKGKHTTTHRELVALPNGAFIVDNPGLRAVGVGGAGEGLGAAFSSIDELAKECRFADCTHTNEPGCKVLEALEAEEITPEAYDNFQRLVRETEHYESTEHERRRKQKSFTAMVKQHKKDYK